MPTIYSVEDAGENGSGYFRKKADALAAARSITKHVEHDIQVRIHRVNKIDLATLISTLNGNGWSDASDVIATARNGRIVVSAT